MKKKKLKGLSIKKTSVSNLSSLSGGQAVLITLDTPFCIGETNPIICNIVTRYCGPFTVEPNCPNPISMDLLNCV